MFSAKDVHVFYMLFTACEPFRFMLKECGREKMFLENIRKFNYSFKISNRPLNLPAYIWLSLFNIYFAIYTKWGEIKIKGSGYKTNIFLNQ